MVMKKTLKKLKRFYHQFPKSLENQNKLVRARKSDSSKASETVYNPMLSVIQEEKVNLFSGCS